MKGKVIVENFEELKLGFLLYVENIIEMEEVSPAMVLIWDHTSVIHEGTAHFKSLAVVLCMTLCVPICHYV